MPRRTRLKPWRGDRWNNCVYNAIERRVAKNIEAIGVPLGIDDPTEQVALIEAVTIELRRAWAYLRDVQSAASEQKARHFLEKIFRSRDIAEAIDRADPTVRYLIEQHDWPSRGKAFIEEIVEDAVRARKSVSRALTTVLQADVHHRPKGTSQFSEHVLAEGLARIFERFGGRATRRFDAYGGYEYGPYRDFVAFVLEIVPKGLKRSPGSGKIDRDPVDYMVRLSARHVRGTPQKPHKYAKSEGDLFSIISSLPVSPNFPPDRDKS